MGSKKLKRLNRGAMFVALILALVAGVSWFLLTQGYEVGIMKPKQVMNTRNSIQYKSIEALMEKADLVVYGKPRNSVRESETEAFVPETGMAGRFYSAAQFQVDKTLKGKPEEGPKSAGGSNPTPEANGIKVFQEAYYYENVLYVLEGYTPMKKDRSYVLFLRYDRLAGGYWILGEQQGKYNVDGADRAENEYAVSDEHYKKLKEELNKLASEFKLRDK